MGQNLILNELFGGIGGFSQGSKITGGFQVRDYVECDEDAIAVYTHYHPNVEVHRDIRNYHPEPGADLYTIGFPCTGTSQAGSRTGLDHPESGLWVEALRCIVEGRPNFVIIENPEGLISNGLRAVLGGLRMAGYTWDDPQLISAAWFGAPHKRNRLFIVAYSHELRRRFREEPTGWDEQIRAISFLARGKAQPRSSRLDDGVPEWLRGIGFDGWWRDNPAPRHPGIPPHTPGRRACIKLYGRAVSPQQAAIALQRVLYLDGLRR